MRDASWRSPSALEGPLDPAGGFLRFAIQESSDAIELRIDAPEVEGMNVEPLFAPFLSGAR